MFYKTPIYGHAYLPFSLSTVEVKKEQVKNWQYKKVVYWRGNPFVIFKNNCGKEIMQSMQAIKHIRCQPGEKNIGAKLTNEQSNQIFVRANKGEDRAALAKEFNITEDTVRKIANLKARIRTTMDFLNNETKSTTPIKAIVATRNKNRKLSASLASFIRKDKLENFMSTKNIAIKFCVSERTVQRIVKGEMYSK